MFYGNMERMWLILGRCWFEMANLLGWFVGFGLRVEGLFPIFCGFD